MSESISPVTEESILRAKIAAEAERRLGAKQSLLNLVDSFGVLTVQSWLTLLTLSPGVWGEYRRDQRILLTLITEYSTPVVQRWLDNVRDSYHGTQG